MLMAVVGQGPAGFTAQRMIFRMGHCYHTTGIADDEMPTSPTAPSPHRQRIVLDIERNFMEGVKRFALRQ